MKLQSMFPAPPSWKHLLWALPLSLFIYALMWWIAGSGWKWGEFYEPGNAWLRDGFRGTLINNFMISALIGAFPILAADWSRTIWPRVALAVFLIAAQIGFGMLFVLSFPVESR